MSSPFVGEIRVFGFNFAPIGWAQCNGQLLPLSQNTALFSLLGTYYGGDGKSTFALPDFQNTVPVHQGQGPGQEWFIGEQQGSSAITLLQTEIPAHNHLLQAQSGNATSGDPANMVMARGLYGSGSQGGAVATYQTTAPNVQMAVGAIGLQGGSQPHNNMMPTLALNYCIALQGVFPPRG